MKRRKEKVIKEDDYKDLDYLGYGMDKDDGLDFLLPYRVIEVVKFKQMKLATVLMGADDPTDLLDESIREFAKDKAEFAFNYSCELIAESEVIVNGQNDIPIRLFTFRKNKKH